MLKAAGNIPRLIVFGPESNEQGNRTAVANLARILEVVVVGDSYPTWSAEYSHTHRTGRYFEYGGAFIAVSDLMGEVPFAGIVSLESRADDAVSKVARKLGLVDTTPSATDVTSAAPVSPDNAPLSVLLRAGMLNDVCDAELAEVCKGAYDVASRALMTWHP